MGRQSSACSKALVFLRGSFSWCFGWGLTAMITDTDSAARRRSGASLQPLEPPACLVALTRRNDRRMVASSPSSESAGLACSLIVADGFCYQRSRQSSRVGLWDIGTS